MTIIGILKVRWIIHQPAPAWSLCSCWNEKGLLTGRPMKDLHGVLLEGHVLALRAVLDLGVILLIKLSTKRGVKGPKEHKTMTRPEMST